MSIPAEPVLASALWAAHQASSGKSASTALPQLSSGCSSIDEAFGKAMQYGVICCISAEAMSGGRELCTAYLCSHLLSSSDATATVVDTALSFDVRNVYRLLLSRFRDEPDAEQRAMQALDRLKIMKVFDFEGLTDSISELRRTLEGAPAATSVPSKAQPMSKTIIGDSEDEDEMLDSPSPPPEQQVPTMQKDAQPAGVASGLLLIDSISHVASPILRNRYIEGQALLTSVMRSLTHLKTRHQLSSLLLNDATTKANVKDESPSIFSMCKIRPALGQSFRHMLDTHLLVHRNSTKPSDTQRGPSGRQYAAEEQGVSIVEVLQDRNGGSLGRWAAFTVDDGGSIKDYG